MCPSLALSQDAYPLLEALLDICSPAEFAQRYAPSSAGTCRNQRLNELHLLLGAVMLRRTKETTLKQLPAKRRQRVRLDMTVDALGDPKEELEEECARLSKSKSMAVAEYMSCLISADVRFLVFAHHLAMLDELEGTLQRDSVRYIRIDGSTAMEQRSQYVKDFQQNHDVQVALLSLTACSQGLTLNSASVVVFAELYWVPGVLLQAEDRAHRLGQVNMVNVHYLVAPGSVDERMFAAVERRASAAHRAVDGGAAGTSLGAAEVTASEALEGLELVPGKKRKEPDDDSDDLELINTNKSSKPFRWAKYE
eukprot:s4692_g1.t1